jgi:hypothetical protein
VIEPLGVLSPNEISLFQKKMSSRNSKQGKTNQKEEKELQKKLSQEIDKNKDYFKDFRQNLVSKFEDKINEKKGKRKSERTKATYNPYVQDFKHWIVNDCNDDVCKEKFALQYLEMVSSTILQMIKK